jgi:enoyl-CoA hydratase
MGLKNIKIGKSDRIATVTINRPKALNALNVETLEELVETFEEMGDDPKVGGVILTGEGEKAFVAGADIAEMLEMGVREAHDFSSLGQETLDMIETLEKPVIAAVNGYALGGGLEIAMACDIILASEKSRFGQPEVKLGTLPGFGGTQRLVRRVGMHLAKEIIFSGLMFDAHRALAMGLINGVYPPEQLMDAAIKMMKTIMANGPVAVALAKSAINNGADLNISTGLIIERDAFAQTFATSDQKEGMKAFLDKRDPKFKGE